MQKIVDRQLNPYEQMCQRKLSQNEVAEMRSNLLGFISTLIEIDQELKGKKSNEKRNNRNSNHTN